MKIVVLDRPRENPGELDWSGLRELGETELYDRTAPEDILARAADADIIATNKTPLTRETISACKKLKYIAVVATGYNMVDTSCGIPVSNVPSYGTYEIAQHAFALLLEVTNRVGHHSAAVRAGRRGGEAEWSFWDYPAIGLSGRTLGIIGCGRIGRTVGNMALAFGMKLLTHDVSDSRENLDALLRASDVITLHCPLTPETRHIIGRETLARVKPGVIIINNSRGGLIDGGALAEALRSGRVYAAGLDVMETEPPSPDDPLLGLDNCIVTPHISWASLDCREKLKNTTIENIRAFIDGVPINLVN